MDEFGNSATKRKRRTNAEMAAVRHAIVDVLTAEHPMTLRQVFYALTVRGVIQKTEKAYHSLSGELVKLRQEGSVPWEWVIDNTRRLTQPATHERPSDVLLSAYYWYRRSKWRDMPVRALVLLEKDALAGIVQPIAFELDTPLLVLRGFPSETVIRDCAEWVLSDPRPVAVLEFGDHDPSGVLNGTLSTPDRLRAHLGDRARDVAFERVALTLEQITSMGLPSRPTKTREDGNAHAAGWEGDSWELDALPPNVLRDLVQSSIRRFLTDEAITTAETAERKDRARLREIYEREYALGH